MIEKENIKIVHVEASSRCNSHCPMCSRYTSEGYVQPNLNEIDLSEKNFYKLFVTEFVNRLDHVYFSGVYGDPCLNKLLPEFVNYLIDNGCKSVSIDTNGGYRSEEWWAKMVRPNVLINFAIDGTDNETLNMYRIGVNYDKVISNLESFVKSGGKAQWNFIVFKHNEHQVEIAKNLAEKIGAEFRIKVTQKFRSHKNFKVYKQGMYLFDLEPPENLEYRHTNVGSKEHNPVTIFKFNLDRYSILNDNVISCKSLQRKEVYLTATGLLLPCCYLGTYTHNSPGSYQFQTQYNLNDFNLNIHSVRDILNNMKSISSKWDKTVAEGNLITCLHTCGSIENTTLYYDKKLQKENILKQ
jgi:MoaA/NifB/PqqE/SkfB family radical SAM enzyme